MDSVNYFYTFSIRVVYFPKHYAKKLCFSFCQKSFCQKRKSVIKYPKTFHFGRTTINYVGSSSRILFALYKENIK